MTRTSVWQRVNAYFTKTWLHVVVLAAAGFIVHFPALQGELLWDDHYLIRTNPLIKSPILVLEAFRHHLFLDSYSSHYRPVQTVSYMLDYAFWNGNTYGFHLTSALLHVGSAILLYLLLGKLLRVLRNGPGREEPSLADGSAITHTSLLAFFISILWAVHPVHSAAVDYISGRADSLAFLFACGGWLLFLKARELSQPLVRYLFLACAWLSGLFALCSRESACVWVVLFLIYVFGFQRPVEFRRKCTVLVACLVLLGAYACLRNLPEPRTQKQPSADWSPSVRAVLMCRALGDYGRLMMFPSNLHMERSVYHPKSFQHRGSRYDVIGLEYLSIIGLLVVGTLIFGAMRKGDGQGLRIFGATWFLLSYLPVSNLVDLNATVAEHWLYLPSVGFLIFLAGIFVALPLPCRKAGMAFACLAALGLGARTYVRSGDWVSSEVFARRTIAAGGATIRVSLMLGQAYLERRDYAGAEKVFRKALELCPDFPLARNNLADALWHQGKTKEAETVFALANHDAHETRKEYPRTWLTILNLARVHHDQHDNATALDLLQKAQQEYPDTWELISFQSEVLRQEGKFDQSIALLRPFAEQHWWHFGAALALGRVYVQKGDVDLARAALGQASRLDIHDTQALNFVAMMQLSRNHFEEAYAVQRRAVSRQPDEPRQYVLLSDILEKMGRTEEARAALAKVSRLRALADNVAVN